MSLNAAFQAGCNVGLRAAFEAPKGARCACGKRAKMTLLSELGNRPLIELCAKCTLVAMECIRRFQLDSRHDVEGLDSKIRDFIIRDSGLSSRTIIAVLRPEFRNMCFDHRFEFGDTPCDPADFGRCYRALKLIPNGVERLGEVAARHPGWKRLVEHWTELTALYEQELPSGKAPKLYARMKELGL